MADARRPGAKRPAARGLPVWLAAATAAASPTHAQDATPELVVQTGHQTLVSAVAFSPDERLVASGDSGGAIRIWEIATGMQVRGWRANEGGTVDRLQFSPDGLWLGSAARAADSDSPAGVSIWEVATAREVRSFELPAFRQIAGLTISADASWIAAAADREVRIWSLTGEEVATIPTDDRATLAFHPETPLLAIREPQRVRFWSPDEVEGVEIRLREFLDYPGDREIVFTANGLNLAVPDGDRTLIVDVAKRKVSGRVLEGSVVKLKSFPSAGSEVVVFNHAVYELWDLDRRDKVRDLLRRDPNQWYDETPSPSWRWIATQVDGDVRIDDLHGERDPLILRRADATGAVAFSPDGSRLVTATGPRFWSWDFRTGEPQLFDPNHSSIDMLTFNRDGTRLLTGDRFGAIIEWDTASVRMTNAVEASREGISRSPYERFSHACSASGPWCVSANGKESRIEVYEIATWRLFRTLEYYLANRPNRPPALAIDDAGAWIAAASGSDGAEVSVWNRTSGSQRHFGTHTGEVLALAFSREGRLLASAGRTGDVKIWEVGSGRELIGFESGHDVVTSLAFSPDDRAFATGGADRTIRIWSPGSGELLRTLDGHADSIAGLAFNPTGRLLASGSGDGTARIWDVDGGAAIALLTQSGDTADWFVVTPDGFFDGSAGADNLVAWRIGDAVYPPERFFNRFFRPGLLAAVLEGRSPSTEVAMDGLVVPPVVRILDAGSRVLSEPRFSIEMRAEGDVGEVILYHNGARVGSRQGAQGEYAFDVELVPGENELRGVAVNPAGVESNPDSIRITYAAPAPARPALHVLTIGVSRYQQSSWNLGFARADAEAIAAFFRDGEGKLFDTVNATVLADDAASRAGIQAAIESISTVAQPQDVVLIYFAGHGAALDQTYYLLPYEMRDEASFEADVRKFGLSDRQLLDSLRKVRALKRIVILDACQSGGALDILGRAPSAQRAALEMLARAEGLFIIAASTRQQDAIEVRELGHGVLTYALLSGLGATGDASVPEIVTVHQLLTHISQQVPELAARYGRTTRQVPVSFHRGMDFPLALR